MKLGWMHLRDDVTFSLYCRSTCHTSIQKKRWNSQKVSRPSLTCLCKAASFHWDCVFWCVNCFFFFSCLFFGPFIVMPLVFCKPLCCHNAWNFPTEGRTKEYLLFLFKQITLSSGHRYRLNRSNSPKLHFTNQQVHIYIWFMTISWFPASEWPKKSSDRNLKPAVNRGGGVTFDIRFPVVAERRRKRLDKSTTKISMTLREEKKEREKKV